MSNKILYFLLYVLPCALFFFLVEYDSELFQAGAALSRAEHLLIPLVVLIAVFFGLRALFNTVLKKFIALTGDIVINKNAALGLLFSYSLFVLFGMYVVLAHKVTDYGKWSYGLKLPNSISRKIMTTRTKREQDKLKASVEIANESGSKELMEFTNEQKKDFELLQRCVIDLKAKELL